MPLQHKIIFGYIILVAVIGSMIAILIYERRQMREVEGSVARLWRMYEDIYTPPSPRHRACPARRGCGRME